MAVRRTLTLWLWSSVSPHLPAAAVRRNLDAVVASGVEQEATDSAPPDAANPAPDPGSESLQVVVTFPESGAVFGQSAPIQVTLTVAGDDGIASPLTLGWTSDRDGELLTESPCRPGSTKASNTFFALCAKDAKRPLLRVSREESLRPGTACRMYPGCTQHWYFCQY